MANANSTNAGVEVFGISPDNLMDLRRIVDPETVIGRVDDFANGVAIGSCCTRLRRRGGRSNQIDQPRWC